MPKNGLGGVVTGSYRGCAGSAAKPVANPYLKKPGEQSAEFFKPKHASHISRNHRLKEKYNREHNIEKRPEPRMLPATTNSPERADTPDLKYLKGSPLGFNNSPAPSDFDVAEDNGMNFIG